LTLARTRSLWQYRELLWVLVARTIRIRYKGSSLGFFWTLLGPVFLILIYAIFLQVLRFPIDLPVLITGILAWHFTSMCSGDAVNAIVGNANLVTKACFPRIILPTAMVLANLFNFLLAMGVLAIYLLFRGPDFGFLAALPWILATHTALCLGISLLLATANVFYRDTEHILGVFLLAWFFLSPVVYPANEVLSRFNPAVHALFFANPMTGILSAYRETLLSSPPVPSGLLALSFASAWAVAGVGWWVFQSAERSFGDEL
jgi:ABC-2 type transport system permease protein